MRTKTRALLSSVAVSALAIGITAPALAQSNDELRRQLQQAQQRIMQLENRMAADLPPATEDGQCFSRVLVPPTPQTFTETIVIEPERTETIFIPPVYDTVTERVVVESERVERRVIPAITEVVTEQVLVEPERLVSRVVGAVTDTITEQVMIEPERVERRIIPAITETVTEQVMIEPERVEQVIIPAVIDTVTEQVLIQPERIETRIVPATYRTITETITITEERIEPVVIPAEYETYTEQVLVREAYFTWQPARPLFVAARGEARSVAEFARDNFAPSDIQELPTGEILCRVEIPAQFETITRTRLVSPERIVYRTSTGGTSPTPVTLPPVTETVTRQELITAEQVIEDRIPAVFETVTRSTIIEPERIMYRTRPGGTMSNGGLSPNPITLPALFETVTRTVVIEPERVVEDRIPARFETVTRTVVIEEERIVDERLPARFETVSREVVVEPERIVEDIIPARFENVSVQRVVTPGREETRTLPAVTREITRVGFTDVSDLAWREVLCEINTTPEAIRQIQIGLRDAGYNPGPADGIFDEQSYQAMVAYQEDNGLIVGQLTRQFVEHLGVPWAPLTVNFYPILD